MEIIRYTDADNSYIETNGKNLEEFSITELLDIMDKLYRQIPSNEKKYCIISMIDTILRDYGTAKFDKKTQYMKDIMEIDDED